MILLPLVKIPGKKVIGLLKKWLGTGAVCKQK